MSQGVGRTSGARVGLLMILGLIPQTASAAKVMKSVRVELPELGSLSNRNVSASSLSAQESEAPSGQFEVTASSWQPSNFSLPARVADVSTFRASRVAMFGAGYVFPLVGPIRGVDLSMRSALSFARLERSGMAGLSGGSEAVTQDLYLLPLQVGVEARPRALRGRWVSPFVSASALPVLALAQRSALDEGKTFLGLAGEVALGVESGLGLLSAPLSPCSLILEGHGSAGSISGSPLRAAGVRGGLRVQL